MSEHQLAKSPYSTLSSRKRKEVPGHGKGEQTNKSSAGKDDRNPTYPLKGPSIEMQGLWKTTNIYGVIYTPDGFFIRVVLIENLKTGERKIELFNTGPELPTVKSLQIQSDEWEEESVMITRTSGGINYKVVVMKSRVTGERKAGVIYTNYCDLRHNTLQQARRLQYENANLREELKKSVQAQKEPKDEKQRPLQEKEGWKETTTFGAFLTRENPKATTSTYKYVRFSLFQNSKTGAFKTGFVTTGTEIPTVEMLQMESNEWKQESVLA